MRTGSGVGSHLLIMVAGSSAVLFATTGCTSTSRDMAKEFDQGKFTEAAIAGDEQFAVIRDGDGVITGLDGVPDRDRLWIGLEKAKILGDAARFGESLEVFTHVYDEQLWLADCESSYAENPIDPANWDVGQFFEDSGQLVVGADQTTFLVQPYEAILAASYASLDAMLVEDPRSFEFARQSMKLQGQWQQNLGLEQVGVRAAPSASIGQADSEVEIDVPGFSLQSLLQQLVSLLNLDEFQKARDQMDAVVTAAAQSGAASPFLPAASLLNWAAFVKADQQPDAISAMEGFKAFSADRELAQQLEQAMYAPEAPDKVLVFVGGGRGPSRDYFSVRVPIPIPSLGTGYFRGVYPTLLFRDDETRPRRIMAGGNPLSVVGSVDAVAAQDFSRREPSLWWTPTIRGLIRVAGTVAAQAATGEQDSWIGLAIVGAGVAFAEAEQPDLRMWTSLPSTYFAALVDRPTSGALELEVVSDEGSSTLSVEVPTGLSLVYVRSLEPGLTVAHATAIRPGRESGRPTLDMGTTSSEPARVDEAVSANAAGVEPSGDLAAVYAPVLVARMTAAGEPITEDEARVIVRQRLSDGPIEAPSVAAGTRDLGPLVPSGDQVITFAAPVDRHAFVKLVALDGSGRSTPLFLPMSRRANLRLVPGEYSVLVATGDDWYGWDLDFGPTAEYFEVSPTVVVESETVGPMTISLGHPEFPSDYHTRQSPSRDARIQVIARDEFIQQ